MNTRYTAHVYPISVVSQKTGLSPEVLRAWERRYDGVRPQRDERGRRLYSKDLVERLRLISSLLDAGYRISEIVDREDGVLRELALELTSAGQAVDARDIPADSTPPEQLVGLIGRSDMDAVSEAVAAARACDVAALRTAAERALTRLGRLGMADGFVFPAIRLLEDYRKRRECDSVHVAFAHANLSILLSGFLLRGQPQLEGERRSRVVIATPPGHSSQLGVLSAALHAQAAGWLPIILGSGITSESIVGVATKQGAQAVLLTLVADEYDVTAYDELTRIRSDLSAEIPVYFGGRMPQTLVSDLMDAGLVGLESMNHLRATLLGRITDRVPKG